MGDGQVLQQVLFFALLLVGLYFLAIRPQRARSRALAQVQGALLIGSTVITSAGIQAAVVGIEDDVLILEVAPGVRMRFLRGAVVRVLDPVRHHDDPDLM